MEIVTVQSRLIELASRASHKLTLTRFLDPREQAIAKNAAKDASVNIMFHGVFDEAERKVAAFFVEDCDPNAVFSEYVTLTRFKFDTRYGSLTHRDILGATLSVVSDRSFIGDIVITGGFVYVAVLSSVADTLVAGLTSAGRVSLTGEIYTGLAPKIESRERFVRDTLASLRLDACVASAYTMSRANAAEAIRKGLVKLDHLETDRTDAKLDTGSLISFRGRGRATLLEITGLSKKGRIGVIWKLTEYKNERV